MLVLAGASLCLVLLIGAGTAYTVWEWDSMVLLEILTGVAVACVLWTGSLTVFTDPGFLPRKDEMKSRATQALNIAYSDMYGLEGTRSDLADHIHQNPPVGPTMYACFVCGAFKATRCTSHCSECDRCVAGKDHHCSFLLKCIGSRNRAQFVSFLFSSCISLLFSLPLMVLDLVHSVIETHWPRVGSVIFDFSPIEISLLLAFGILFVLKLFLFPFTLSYMANLQALIILFVTGFLATTAVVVKGHVPLISAFCAYIESVLLFLIGSSLYYQLKLLSEGSTIRELISSEQDVLTGKSLLDETSERPSGKSPLELIFFVLRGFWLSNEPKYMSN